MLNIIKNGKNKTVATDNKVIPQIGIRMKDNKQRELS